MLNDSLSLGKLHFQSRLPNWVSFHFQICDNLNAVKVRTSSDLCYSEHSIHMSLKLIRPFLFSLPSGFHLALRALISSCLFSPSLSFPISSPSPRVRWMESKRRGSSPASIYPSVSTASIEAKHLLQTLWEAARSGVLKKFKSSLISFSLPLQTENEGEGEIF